VDEASSDPEFFVFHTRLQAAVATHDTAEIMRVVAPGIRTSLGSDNRRDELRLYLRSPIDYCAGLVRRQGRWWLRALIRGD
jgi:hypothetical protein